MVLGDYPCCGAPLCFAVPEKTPMYFREACPSCGQIVWHRLSRWDPKSWAEADFLAEHEIDEKTKVIRSKRESIPLTDDQRRILAKQMEDYFLYGATATPTPQPKEKTR